MRRCQRMRSAAEIFLRRGCRRLRSDDGTAVHHQRNCKRNSGCAHCFAGDGVAEVLSRAEPGGSNAINGYNYHLLTTAQIEHHAGRRTLQPQLGKNATRPGRGRGGWRRRAAGQPESGPAAEHEHQLQLEPLGVGQREHVSAVGRQERIGFELACRPATRWVTTR